MHVPRRGAKRTSFGNALRERRTKPVLKLAPDPATSPCAANLEVVYYGDYCRRLGGQSDFWDSTELANLIGLVGYLNYIAVQNPPCA
jgi:hypothetical protein